MKELEEYFRKLRFDDKFHLGLGDVRLTIAMQNEIVEIANRNASQQSVQLTLAGVCLNCERPLVDGVCAPCFAPERQSN